MYLPELKIILEHFVRLKELEIEAKKFDTERAIHENQLNYDLQTPLTKKEAEYQHIKELELIKAKKAITQQFIDANTQTIVSTKWSLFGKSVTQTEKHTLFSESDLSYFQENILEYTDPTKRLPQIAKTNENDNSNSNSNENFGRQQIAGNRNMDDDNVNDDDECDANNSCVGDEFETKEEEDEEDVDEQVLLESEVLGDSWQQL